MWLLAYSFFEKVVTEYLLHIRHCPRAGLQCSTIINRSVSMINARVKIKSGDVTGTDYRAFLRTGLSEKDSAEVV